MPSPVTTPEIDDDNTTNMRYCAPGNLTLIVAVSCVVLILTFTSHQSPCTRVVSEVSVTENSREVTPTSGTRDTSHTAEQIQLPDDIELVQIKQPSWIPKTFLEAPRFCNNYTYKNIIGNVDLCRDHDVFLLVGVRTEARDIDCRQLIRRTWGAKNNIPSVTIRVVFLLGANKSPSLQSAIEQENSAYHDIVQGEYIDTYQNLTLKSMMIFKWMRDNCRHAKYFMMADSDLFVDIYKVVRYLQTTRSSSDTVYTLCKVEWTEKPFRPPRFGGHSAMPYEEYNTEQYSTYCWGGTYVATVPLINKLYLTALHTPRLRIDDVWTGILAARAGLSFPPTSEAYVLPWHNTHKFLYHKKYFDGPIMFAAWHGSPSERHSNIKRIWNKVHSHNQALFKSQGHAANSTVV